MKKVVSIPALMCGQAALGSTRCRGSYIGQELAVFVVSKLVSD